VTETGEEGLAGLEAMIDHRIGSCVDDKTTAARGYRNQQPSGNSGSNQQLLANPENRRAPASPAPASERVLRPQICGLTAVKPRRPSAPDQLFNAAERYPGSVACAQGLQKIRKPRFLSVSPQLRLRLT
jgi:hypothetical protein